MHSFFCRLSIPGMRILITPLGRGSRHRARWSKIRRWAAASVIVFGAAQAWAQITRVANSTLAFPQNPQTFGYTTEDAFAGLTFDQPLGLVTPPGETDRVFVLEKTGRIQVVSNLGSTPAKQVFLDLSAKVLTSSEEGLLGLAFHPNFATNRYFYVFYSTTATTSAGSGAHERLSRFTALASPATNADILATELPMISQFDEADNHNGGDLHFGPDGYLYVSLGDEGGGNDTFNNSQRIDKDFFSGILRIDVDQRAAGCTLFSGVASGCGDLVARDVCRHEDRLDRLLVRRQVGREAALVTDGGREAAVV